MYVCMYDIHTNSLYIFFSIQRGREQQTERERERETERETERERGACIIQGRRRDGQSERDERERERANESERVSEPCFWSREENVMPFIVYHRCGPPWMVRKPMRLTIWKNSWRRLFVRGFGSSSTDFDCMHGCRRCAKQTIRTMLMLWRFCGRARRCYSCAPFIHHIFLNSLSRSLSVSLCVRCFLGLSSQPVLVCRKPVTMQRRSFACTRMSCMYV